MRRRRFMAGLALSGALPAGAREAFRPSVANVLRSARGTIEYRNPATGELTGGENWSLIVHPDGSRTLQATNVLHGLDYVHTTVLRVGADFSPREAFIQYFTGGAFRNAALFAVRDGTLWATAVWPDHRSEERIDVPPRFSFIPHLLSSNVWHGWYYDQARGGAQPIAVYDVDTGYGGSTLAGAMKFHMLESRGRVTVTVPAGRFECEQFRFDGAVDYFVTGEDQLFVKFSWPQVSREYVLTSLDR